jgi:hypothetical protein
VAALLTLLLLGAVLAGCSGDDVGDSATEAPMEGGSGAGFDPDIEVEGAPDAGEDTGGQDAAGDAPAQERSAAQLAALGRERIRTAWITLELEDPEAAVDEVTRTVEAHGGFVALADLARDERNGDLRGTVTLRVPSEELLPTLDDLEALAVDAPIRRIEEEDVSAQLTDLRAQLTNLAAYEEELRALLTEIREATSDPDDLLPVVERLQSVRSDIDRLRAQRDRLQDRVALSTITVTLTPTPTEAPIVTTSWTPMRTLEEALAATGRALTTVADAAIWLLVTALPVTLVVAGPPAALVWWLQRRRSTAPVDARPAAPPPPAS